MLTDDQRVNLGHLLEEVAHERDRQERKCVENRHLGWCTCADPRNDDGTRLAILSEEFGEVGRTMCEERASGYPSRAAALVHRREELIQLCAVAIAWVEAIDAEHAVLPREQRQERAREC